MKQIRRMRHAGFFFCLMIGVAIAATPLEADETTGSIDVAAAPGGDDLACAHAPAGSVPQVPAPFDNWTALVCAPQSHALVPVEGMVWFAHGTTDPVSILALPPGASPVPKSDDYNPSYGVRFKELLGAEAKGERLEHAKAFIQAAFEGEAVPQFDHVYQLDAVSIIYDLRYNIYFYVEGKQPHVAIACIDHCRQALVMDVLTTAEARARVAGLR